MSNSNHFALPAALLTRFVELADQTHWDGAIASGRTPAEIVDMVLGHVATPLTIDDYESFVGAIRTLPAKVWEEPWIAGPWIGTPVQSGRGYNLKPAGVTT